MPSCPMMETSANVHTEPEAPRRQGRTCRDRQRTPPKKRHDPKRATPECPASHERASGLYFMPNALGREPATSSTMAELSPLYGSTRSTQGYRGYPTNEGLNAQEAAHHRSGCVRDMVKALWFATALVGRTYASGTLCAGTRDVQRARDYQLPTGVINMRGRRHFRRYLQFCSALSISANFSSAPLVL